MVGFLSTDLETRWFQDSTVATRPNGGPGILRLGRNAGGVGWFASLFLGASLAACTGLRAFLPLLVVGVVSRHGLAGDFRVPPLLAWLQTDPALLAVGALAFLEILSDKTRWISAFFEVPLVLLRPVASVLTCLAVLNLPTVQMNFVAAMAIGLVFSLPLLRLKSGFRIFRGDEASSFFDPGLSLAEDILAGGAAVLSFYSPVVVFLVLLAVSFWLLTRVRLAAFRRARVEEEAERPAQATEVGYGPPQPGLRRPR